MTEIIFFVFSFEIKPFLAFNVRYKTWANCNLGPLFWGKLQYSFLSVFFFFFCLIYLSNVSFFFVLMTECRYISLVSSPIR